jgi:hypothetical protein
VVHGSNVEDAARLGVAAWVAKLELISHGRGGGETAGENGGR